MREGVGAARAALAAFAAFAALAAIGIAPARAAGPGNGAIALTDDWGRSVRIAPAPRRIVSLAPHSTELLFAAGAGERVVGVDPHSRYPESARKLPRVASFPSPDRERLLALRPDLVVVWGSAASRDSVARIESIGTAVFVSDPRTLDAIGDAIEVFAVLAPDPATGRASAGAYRKRLSALRERYAKRAPVPVFVQSWPKPLITLSDRDVIGDALASCGARNVFADAPVAAPQVNAEAVLAARPRLIVAAGAGADRVHWDALGALEPRGRIAFARIDAAIQRPTDRILDAVEQLCAAVDAVR